MGRGIVAVSAFMCLAALVALMMLPHAKAASAPAAAE
jgi:hypothetical protein